MNPRSNSAFTLVELLVVITIIAVLAALLMPALGSARDRANTAACASNLQRAGTVFATFLNDHNGFYPYISAECMPVPKPGFAPCTGPTSSNSLNACASLVNGQYISDGNWDPSCPQSPLWPGVWNGSACCMNHWVYQVAPYFGSGANNYAKTLRCQSNPWPWPPTVAANYTAIVTYRINGNMFPLTYRGPWQSAGGANPGSPMGWSRMVNMSDIDHPSSVMFMGEVAYNMGLIPNYWSAFEAVPIGKNPSISTCYVTNYVTWNPCYCDNHFAAGTSWTGSCTGSGDGQYTILQVTPTKSCNAMVAYWHNNGMNVLKVDGHVERVDKKTLQAYSIQCMLQSPSTPGGIFWSDGKGADWYYNQYPGGTWPYNQ